jgi:hypothetical protein
MRAAPIPGPASGVENPNPGNDARRAQVVELRLRDVDAEGADGRFHGGHARQARRINGRFPA